MILTKKIKNDIKVTIKSIDSDGYFVSPIFGSDTSNYGDFEYIFIPISVKGKTGISLKGLSEACDSIFEFIVSNYVPQNYGGAFYLFKRNNKIGVEIALALDNS